MSRNSSIAKRTPSTIGKEEDFALLVPRLEEAYIPSPYEQLLASVDSKAEQFCQIATSPASTDPELELVGDKEGCLVYSKTTPDGFVLRSEWTVPYSPKVYLDFLGNLEERKTWDKHIDEMKLVEQLTPEINVFYQSYKGFFTISPRDLVIACKKFETEKAWVDACCSIEFPACPLKHDFIRATITLGGYYVEATETGGKVVSYTEGSFGGSIPRALVKKFSATNIPNFVKTVNQALEAHLRRTEGRKSLARST